MLAQNSISGAGAAITMSLVGAVLVVSGIALIAIARRTADGRIGPNALMGVRTRATRASNGAWRTAHETARGPSIAAGWLLIGLGPASAALGAIIGRGDADRAMAIWGVMLGVGSVIVTLLVGKGALDGHRAAKRFTESG